MPNVESVRAISIYYKIFKFQVDAAIIFLVIVYTHTHTHTRARVHARTHTHTHTHTDGHEYNYNELLLAERKLRVLDLYLNPEITDTVSKIMFNKFCSDKS